MDPTITRADILQSCVEAQTTQLRIRGDQIIDLENELKTFVMLSGAALDSVARLTARNKQLARRLDELNERLQFVLAQPCLECRRRERELVTV